MPFPVVKKWMSGVFHEFGAKIMDIKGALSRNLSLKIQTKGTASKLGETLNINYLITAQNNLKIEKDCIRGFWKPVSLTVLEKFIFDFYNVWYNALEAYLFDTTHAVIFSFAFINFSNSIANEDA